MNDKQRSLNRAQELFKEAVHQEALLSDGAGHFRSHGDLRPSFVAPITSAVLADGIGAIAKDSLQGTPPHSQIRLNARDYADIRKFGRDIIVIESDPALLGQGLMGTIWGAMVIIDRDIQPGQVLFLAEGAEEQIDPARMLVMEFCR
jgi:hypothetical protein